MTENSLLDWLDSQTFTGGQVQRATGAGAPLVNRQCNAYGLQLFSPDGTRGRGRDYCLADIMQLALALELGRSTARPQRVAAALNNIAGFQGSAGSRMDDDSDQSFQYRLLDLEHNRTLRAAGKDSVRALPELYWAEDRPIFIHIWPGFVGQDVIDDPNAKLRDGLFLNATQHLRFVRMALAETVKAD